MLFSPRNSFLYNCLIDSLGDIQYSNYMGIRIFLGAAFRYFFMWVSFSHFMSIWFIPWALAPYHHLCCGHHPTVFFFKYWKRLCVTITDIRMLHILQYFTRFPLSSESLFMLKSGFCHYYGFIFFQPIESNGFHYMFSPSKSCI